MSRLLRLDDCKLRWQLAALRPCRDLCLAVFSTYADVHLPMWRSHREAGRGAYLFELFSRMGVSIGEHRRVGMAEMPLSNGLPCPEASEGCWHVGNHKTHVGNGKDTRVLPATCHSCSSVARALDATTSADTIHSLPTPYTLHPTPYPALPDAMQRVRGLRLVCGIYAALSLSDGTGSPGRGQTVCA